MLENREGGERHPLESSENATEKVNLKETLDSGLDALRDDLESWKEQTELESQEAEEYAETLESVGEYFREFSSELFMFPNSFERIQEHPDMQATLAATYLEFRNAAEESGFADYMDEELGKYGFREMLQTDPEEAMSESSLLTPSYEEDLESEFTTDTILLSTREVLDGARRIADEEQGRVLEKVQELIGDINLESGLDYDFTPKKRSLITETQRIESPQDLQDLEAELQEKEEELLSQDVGLEILKSKMEQQDSVLSREEDEANDRTLWDDFTYLFQESKPEVILALLGKQNSNIESYLQQGDIQSAAEESKRKRANLINQAITVSMEKAGYFSDEEGTGLESEVDKHQKLLKELYGGDMPSNVKVNPKELLEQITADYMLEDAESELVSKLSHIQEVHSDISDISFFAELQLLQLDLPTYREELEFLIQAAQENSDLQKLIEGELSDDLINVLKFMKEVKNKVFLTPEQRYWIGFIVAFVASVGGILAASSLNKPDFYQVSLVSGAMAAAGTTMGVSSVEVKVVEDNISGIMEKVEDNFDQLYNVLPKKKLAQLADVVDLDEDQRRKFGILTGKRGEGADIDEELTNSGDELAEEIESVYEKAEERGIDAEATSSGNEGEVVLDTEPEAEGETGDEEEIEDREIKKAEETEEAETKAQ